MRDAAGDPVAAALAWRMPPRANARAIALFDIWQARLARERRLPTRDEVLPAVPADLHDNIWEIEVKPEAPRFLIRRLAPMMRRFGIRVVPGNYIDVESPGTAVLPDLEAAAAGMPVWYRGEPSAPHHFNQFRLERLFLPLGRPDVEPGVEGIEVEGILCLSLFYTLRGLPL